MRRKLQKLSLTLNRRNLPDKFADDREHNYKPVELLCQFQNLGTPTLAQAISLNNSKTHRSFMTNALRNLGRIFMTSSHQKLA